MSSFGCANAILKPDTEGDWIAGRLAAELPSIPVFATCAEVYRSLNQADGQRAAAVVDGNGHVVGLVNRLRFLAKYAQRFIPELYDRRPIMALANPQPLVVDEHMPISDVSAMITFDHPDALRECFVITREERYLGIATSEALLRAKLAMLTVRETQLNAALVAAEDADRTRSNFLALMSHELRTPLNAIIGFSEVLAGELFGAHTVPRYGEYARDIHGAGKHLLALINDILDLSKSEAGYLQLSKEPIDVRAVLYDGVRLLAARASQGEVSTTVKASHDLPFLCGDLLRIKQVVLNLVSNAVKFTPSGGQVSLSAFVDDRGRITMDIADTGIGMEADQIKIALEPFRQIDSPLSRNVEGTGLGLSLAKSLVERHDGALSIESAPGNGTTVRLTFPAERTIWPELSKSA